MGKAIPADAEGRFEIKALPAGRRYGVNVSAKGYGRVTRNVAQETEGRRIELEVRTAQSNFIEAKDVLDSQKKVVEEAEEALRLARSRYEAGTGTQLDVLSAQTALTEARTTEIQALHDYSAARARLERAVGMNLPAPAAQASK
jgi:outer membrane protein TolC